VAALLEDSGAGTISGQGGQDQKRQSLLREIRFFAEIGFGKRSLKKKVFTGFGVAF